MRQIKFRGKCSKGEHKGEWVYGGICSWLAESKTGKKVPRTSVVVDNFRLTTVQPETVGQCVGLQDMNGRDIYEGDILLKSSHKYQVIYDQNKAAFALRTDKDTCLFGWHILPAVVIGNIIDNPDLMQ